MEVYVTSKSGTVYKDSHPELSNPLSCQLGPKTAPPGSPIERREALKPKFPGIHSLPLDHQLRALFKGGPGG